MTELNVRELPPLDLAVRVTDPKGRSYRWAGDASDVENVPNDLTFSSTIPGGHEQCECRLPRDPSVSYPDLSGFSDVIVEGVGGRRAGRFMLERRPTVSGDEFAVTPGAVGYQALLDYDKSIREIYIDQDLTRWGPLSSQRRLGQSVAYGITEPSLGTDDSSGAPVLVQSMQGSWAAGATALNEAWYGVGIPIGQIDYSWRRGSNLSSADPNWNYTVRLSDDDLDTARDATGNLLAAGPSSGSLAATTRARKYAALIVNYAAVASGQANMSYDLLWPGLTIFGTHGLTLRGTRYSSSQGLLASDVLAHAVCKWGQGLALTSGGISTIESSGFLIPQLVFYDATTLSEIVRQSNRFELKDWAVWDKAFWYYSRGAGPSRKWRARASASQLNETGPQAERTWNRISVQYTDVTGETKMVGPPGTVADVTSTLLVDPDTENAANKAGLAKGDLLVMGVSTQAGAIEVGRRFLIEAKALDRSGQASLNGYVVDDRGIVHPAWAVNAGDSISFIDTNDTRYRRIVRASYSDANKTCSIDLDSPPEGLQALLERLSVVLVPLGLS